MERVIRVDDQPNGHWYLATGGLFVLSPNTIQLSLVLGGSVSGSATLLNASGGNGIVAVNDGGLGRSDECGVAVWAE